MKLSKRLFSAILSIAILLSFPVSVKAQTTSKSIFDSKTYTHQTQFDKCGKYQGVDLSKHNGDVDFAKMKKAGVKYVILRAGYRGYAEEGTLNKDIKFDTYINAAAKQGLDIGIYFYSQAVTNAEAQYEAKYTINLIKNYKKYITLPVAFDYEFAEVSSGRFDKRWKNKTLNKTKCTAIAKAFCDYMSSSGYKAMVYANKSFLSEVIDGNTLAKSYPIWMANYTTKTTYSGSFYIWQFSSTGKIDGVSGSVDANFLYSTTGLSPNSNEFTVSSIPDTAYTGSEVYPVPTVSYKGYVLKKDTDYTLTYSNNKEIGKASIVINGINDCKSIPAKTVYFYVVPVQAAKPELVTRGVSTLKIKWAAQEDINGYRISYKNGNTWKALASTTATEYELKKLNPARTYQLVIQAYKTVNNVNYYGIMSPVAYIATKPDKVANLKVSANASNAIKLHWTKQYGADKYIIYKYEKAQNKYVKCAEVYGGNNTAIVYNLLPNTKYSFKVQAYKKAETNEEMFGTISNDISDYTSPPAPVLNGVSANGKRINTKWSKSAGAAGYQIAVATNKSFSKNKKTKKIKSKKAVKGQIVAKKAKKTHYVRVRSYRIRNGKTYYSSWSNVKTVKTK